MVCGLSISQRKHTSRHKDFTQKVSLFFDVETSREKLRASQIILPYTDWLPQANHRRLVIRQWSSIVQKSCIVKQRPDTDTNTELWYSRQLANPLNAWKSNVQRILVHIDVLQCKIPGYLTLTTVSFWLVYKYVESLHFSYSSFGKGKSSDFTNWGWAVRLGTASRSGPGHPLVSLQACNTTIRCGPNDSWLLYVALCINQYQLNLFGRVF